MLLLSISRSLWKSSFFNTLSDVLNKFVSILFWKKQSCFILKDALCSSPISHFTHLQWRNFWGKLQIFSRVLLLSHATSESGRNISWKVCINENVLFTYNMYIYKLHAAHPLFNITKYFCWKYSPSTQWNLSMKREKMY